MTRYRYIDMLKGFGMLLVMADHSGLPLCPVLDYLEVPVFFFASGFLFSSSSFDAFLRRKALRIVVPYLVYSLLFILACMPFGLDVGSLKRFVWMLLTPANYPLWFFKALLWCLLIFWGLWRVGAMVAGMRRPVALLASMAAGVVVCGACRGHEIVLMTGLPQAVAALALMIGGYWVRQWVPKHSEKKRLLVIASLLMVGAYVIVHGHIAFHACNLGRSPLLFYPMALLTCATFLALFMAIDSYLPIRAISSHLFYLFPFSFLSFVGRRSLLYFCLHAIPIYILHTFGLTDTWIVLLCSVIVTTICIYLIHDITPLRKLGLA